MGHLCIVCIVPALHPVAAKMKCIKTAESKLQFQACFNCSGVSSELQLQALPRTRVQTKSFCAYNNKPRFTTKLSELRHTQEEVHRSRVRVLRKEAWKALTREIIAVWRSCSEKLKNEVSSQRPRFSVERPERHHHLQDPHPHPVVNKQLAGELNSLYWHFFHQPPTQSTTLNPYVLLEITATHSDHPPALRVCADQLAPIFTQILTRFQELHQHPAPRSPPSQE